MQFPYFIADSIHDQLKTRLAFSTSGKLSCASVNKLDSTDKARSPGISVVATCENLCLYIAVQILHCFASSFVDKHMSYCMTELFTHVWTCRQHSAG